MSEANPIVTLKAKIKEFGFSELKAGESNKSANSGETMYFDFPRMNFVINGKIIDTVLTSALMEGAQYRKSNLFNSYDIYSTETAREKQREIDTDYGRAFVDSVLKDLEKELAHNALCELWKSHCKNSEIPDYQKTTSYGKDFERFYNAGREHLHLLLKVGDENKNYRPFVKEVFKEMFQYAEASVPNDSILEEIITNCNQAGYEFAVSIPILESSLLEYGLKGEYSKNKTMCIDCADPISTKVKSDMLVSITKFDNPGEKICDLSTSLEFVLESQDGKDGVTYKDGKLLLTIPKELKNYKGESRNLFDIIKEYFQKFCEKLGFKFEIKTQKIEHDLDDSLKVNSHLESLRPPICSNNYALGH
ncbi:hypothetical protein [Wolbachia endosymbiont (group B) of Sphaerophoria taeniata]|uniref:hypothetical protein n=1 Tax=Wolbachia endosymbiont (group B) of Sphaerophoria taeniata TaxID=2954058 RepID=UPI0022207CD3|nr:hypothetical protein [Wolbachia endosymbiont (group B) of Sphaerophoria taeniata]